MVKRGQVAAPVRGGALVLCVVLLLGGVLVACNGGASRPTAAAPPTVVIASFNFPESELLAEIYAQALQHAGVRIRRELSLGPREMVLPALHAGLVDVVPEYLGSALAALIPSEPSSRLSGSAAATIDSELGTALAPWHVRPLAWAAAENQNGLAVTRDTAIRLGLHNTSDLKDFASSMVLSGPTECPTRPYCLLGYQDRYALRFKSFVAYDAESQRVTALQQGVAEVAVMFTTDGQLATGDPVLLPDDQHLQPPENIVPLVSEKAISAYGPRLVDTLDAISAKLTTSSLVFLNWRISVVGQPIAAEATAWLHQEGFIPRPGHGRD